MKKPKLFSLFCWILLLANPLPASEIPDLPAGLTYRNESSLFTFTSIHILEVDTNLFKIITVRAHDSGLGRETTESLASRYGAVAAVNGGFFEIGTSHDGLPRGILKIRDDWYATPYKNRAAIGWRNGGKDVLIDRLFAKCWARVNNKEIPLEGINRPGIVPMAYNHSFNKTTLTPFESKEMIIINNKVSALRDRGSSPIPEDGWVLSYNFFTGVNIGDDAHCFLKLRPQYGGDAAAAHWSAMDYIVGGTPLLIFNGEKITDFSEEKTREEFLTDHYARTAIGILPNGHWVFVAVDGNIENGSFGMTMEQLAAYMKELGCVYALNMDGGGSTTMVLNGELANDPNGDEDEAAEGQQRRVSDAILVIPR